MQIKSVLPWQIMPGNKILHEIDGVVQVTFIPPEAVGPNKSNLNDSIDLVKDAAGAGYRRPSGAARSSGC